jgi:hypothetical protein
MTEFMRASVRPIVTIGTAAVLSYIALHAAIVLDDVKLAAAIISPVTMAASTFFFAGRAEEKRDKQYEQDAEVAPEVE